MRDGPTAAWDSFVGFMQATGEKISSWWSANRNWAAPVGGLALMDEYPNTRTNPEIIAPQNILRQTIREEQGRQDDSAILSAINAGIRAIVEAINSQDYSTRLDGKTLMQSVERAQRQRGADIMGGGVLG